MASRPRRLWFCLLLIALLGTPWLGVMHGVLHARSAPAGASLHTHQAQTTSTQPPSAAVPSGWWSHLFDDHRAGGDCQLFDQASHGDQAAPLPASAVPPGGAVEGSPRWMQRAWAAALVPHFDARAPPIQG